MGHITESKEAVYAELIARLNRNPVGAPPDANLMEILVTLYSSLEAEVGSKFPLMPVTLAKLSRLTGIEPVELEPVLDTMADKGLVMDFPRRDTRFYMLAPMVVGFFEYTFMRVRPGVDYRQMALLFERYFASAEVRSELFGSKTQMFRTLVYENVIPAAVETEVLTYERASEIIREANGGALGMCACRHKASHLGKACSAPIDDVCTSLGAAAEWLIRRGMARPATTSELLNVLDRTQTLGFVHLGDNVMANPTFICHCCSCCCGVLRSINESGVSAASPSNFRPEMDVRSCTGCGECVRRCPVGALSIGAKEQTVAVDRDRCIGCGVCVQVCPQGVVRMERKTELVTPPATKNEQLARILREKELAREKKRTAR